MISYVRVLASVIICMACRCNSWRSFSCLSNSGPSNDREDKLIESEYGYIFVEGEYNLRRQCKKKDDINKRKRVI